jgi:hypothetical protein
MYFLMNEVAWAFAHISQLVEMQHSECVRRFIIKVVTLMGQTEWPAFPCNFNDHLYIWFNSLTGFIINSVKPQAFHILY